MAVIAELTLSSDSRTTAGILLLTLVAVEFGGLVVLRVVRGRQPATPFQRSFARAGHAHAGVLVTLALVGQILADARFSPVSTTSSPARGSGWPQSSSRPGSSSRLPAKAGPSRTG
jgi:hypothetical protein